MQELCHANCDMILNYLIVMTELRGSGIQYNRCPEFIDLDCSSRAIQKTESDVLALKRGGKLSMF